MYDSKLLLSRFEKKKNIPIYYIIQKFIQIVFIPSKIVKMAIYRIIHWTLGPNKIIDISIFIIEL